MKAGDQVKFKAPFPDEVGLKFIVLEMRGDRALIEAQVPMTFKPTEVQPVADLELCAA